MRPNDPRYALLPVEGAAQPSAELAYVIGCFPIMDPYARYLYARTAGIDRLVANTEAYFVTRAAMQEGNPQRILDRCEPVYLPPTLIIQGTADTNIPVALTECFAAAYKLAGGEIDLHEFPGMPHGFAGWSNEALDKALYLVKQFIARQSAWNHASVA